MTDTIEAVTLEVQRAIEQMPYLDEITLEEQEDGTEVRRPQTLREFYEGTWQGSYADELFTAVGKVAAQAAIASHTKALIEQAGDLEGYVNYYDDMVKISEAAKWRGMSGKAPKPEWMPYDQAIARITELETALAEARNAALEEAAKVVDRWEKFKWNGIDIDDARDVSAQIAQAIRDMKDRT